MNTEKNRSYTQALRDGLHLLTEDQLQSTAQVNGIEELAADMSKTELVAALLTARQIRGKLNLLSVPSMRAAERAGGKPFDSRDWEAFSGAAPGVVIQPYIFYVDDETVVVADAHGVQFLHGEESHRYLECDDIREALLIASRTNITTVDRYGFRRI